MYICLKVNSVPEKACLLVVRVSIWTFVRHKKGERCRLVIRMVEEAEDVVVTVAAAVFVAAVILFQ